MRGLTFEEADILRRTGSFANGIEWDEDSADNERLTAIHDRLLVRGLLSVSTSNLPEDDHFDLLDEYALTDIGRLALRVSIPGMPVPIG